MEITAVIATRGDRAELEKDWKLPPKIVILRPKSISRPSRSIFSTGLLSLPEND